MKFPYTSNANVKLQHWLQLETLTTVLPNAAMTNREIIVHLKKICQFGRTKVATSIYLTNGNKLIGNDKFKLYKFKFAATNAPRAWQNTY